MGPTARWARLFQGAYISGAAHIALIVWALFAGFFLRAGTALPLQTMDVTVLSAEQFAELTAPPVPDLPQPEVVTAPAQVEAPEPVEDVAPEIFAPATDSAPETAPQPELAIEPVAEDAPVQPLLPEPPKPAAADRVAPQAAPTPPDDVDRGPEVSEQVAPDETADIAAPEQPATAPQEAAPEIVTEAEEAPDPAPVRSPRPTARPATIAAAAPEQSEPEPDQSDAINDAVAAATEATSDVPAGPPMTDGEKAALRVAVEECWNIGSLSSEALQTTVTVFVVMHPDGTPDAGTIRMLDFEGGGDAAARHAYEAARRAIIRCGVRGFNLPQEKYSQWREIEMIFNPKGMRLK